MESRHKIFVSAVTKELKSAREKVARTLRFLCFDPVFQEEFSSRTGIVRAALEREISPCVGVIQLVGYRYGWDLHDVSDPSESMSYTHYEARHSHQNNLPIWYLVTSDDYPVDNSNDEDAEKRALQLAYRIRVQRTGHLHYTVSDLKDVELTIFRMLLALDALRPSTLRWTRPALGKRDDVGGQSVGPGGASDNPFSPTTTKEELEQMMRSLLAEFVPALQLARLSGNSETQEQREDDLYIRLGTMLDVQPDEARTEIEELARRRHADKTAGLLERSRAAYALKDYEQAEKLAGEAGLLAAHCSPPDISQQVASLVQAGQCAAAQVKYSKALEYYETAASQTNEERDVLEWIQVRNNIGWLYYLQGRYSDQVTLMRSVWHTGERSGHGRNSAVLRAHMLLANALDDQGKHLEAEQEHRAVVQASDHLFGEDHPDTIERRSNLAIALWSQGKNDEAEHELCKVLEMRERVLGAEHPDTLKSRNNHAETLRALGKLTCAEKEHRSVMMIRERIMGIEHPSTILSCFNLAKCLVDQEKFVDALGFAQLAERGWKKTLGVEHPNYVLAEKLREQIEAAGSSSSSRNTG